MTLYEIDAQIMGCVDEETGEVIDLKKLDQLQMDREIKIENTALYIKNLLSDAAQIREEEKKLADRRKVCENKAESLKHYLSGSLAGDKFRTPRVSISYRKSEAVAILDEEAIPDEFMRYKDPEPDKTAIKAALKSGQKVEGAALAVNQSIQIR